MTGRTDGPGGLDGPPWYVANELLALVLEMVAIGSLAWWGFVSGGSLPLRVLLGIGAPAAAIVLWGLFAAPRARYRPPLPGVLPVKALVLLGAAAALYALGQAVLAVVYGVVVVLNTTVAEVFRRA